ncbi:MAG: hypothetical protein ACHQQ3_11390 [Gemmatimonadales bacterium]
MTTSSPATTTPDPTWPLWQRLLFRLFFAYLILQIAPWGWLRLVPFTQYVLRYWYQLVRWAVFFANDHFLHVRDKLLLPNGSGDTSYGWAQIWLYCYLAAIAAVAWSVLDRKRAHYERLSLWLRMIVRYYVATAALSYGIIKLFALQMVFPSLSQLATPLGDFLPMRFSWLFIGYSTPYQMFAGVAETTAGLLLLYRPTITAGLFVAMGAFVNVVMYNLDYDVPVKIYSMHLLFCCLFLLAMDYKRLISFFLLNQATPGTTAWAWNYTRPWQRWLSRVAKAYLVWLVLISPLQSSYARWLEAKKPTDGGPFRVGVYDVKRYVVNRDTIAVSSADTLRWKDVIFDTRRSGSVNTTDPMFWQRYRRGYFLYKPDTVAHTVAVWRSSFALDSTFLFNMKYEVPDTNTIQLRTLIHGDSLLVELARTNRHFQLTERQFHWLSEYNR